MMVTGDITKDGLSKCKVDSCGVCNMSEYVNSVLCVQCAKWINGRCVRMEIAIPEFSRILACMKSEGYVLEAVKQNVM